MSCVFGYTIGNDVSERTWQKADRTMWRAKNTDTFKPMGPWIETDVELADMRTRVSVNGDQKIDFSRRGMIMGVLNVTPDSFSDGGEFFDATAAVEHGLEMAHTVRPIQNAMLEDVVSEGLGLGLIIRVHLGNSLPMFQFCNLGANRGFKTFHAGAFE